MNVHFSGYFDHERSSTWELLHLREAVWQACGVEWNTDGTVVVTFKGSEKGIEACQLASAISREFRFRQDALSAGQADKEGEASHV